METELTSAGPFDSSELALNQYSLLISNLSGKVRQERMDGRDYIVAPLTMICPGVLSGSKGPLYYPLSEISRNADAWNNMPITKGHPQKEDGSPCSARSPRVLEKVGIGTVFNAQVNGKLIAEGWFDVEKTKRVSPSTYNKLVKGEVEELSTGLFTDNEPVKNLQDALFNGKAYTHTARNYRPDHLAILPDSKGACSKDDGCGVNVNEASPTWDDFELETNEELVDNLDLSTLNYKDKWEKVVLGTEAKFKVTRAVPDLASNEELEPYLDFDSVENLASHNDIREAIQVALQEKYPAPSSYSYSRSEVGAVSLAYVVDVFAKDFVYHEPDGTLCKLGYLVDKSGKVEIDSGAPTKVRRTTSYQPVGNAEFYEEIHSWYELVANDAGCGKECKCKDCKKKNKVEQPSEDAYSGNQWTKLLENAFCPTGKGGGVDPTCGSGKGGSGGGGSMSYKDLESSASEGDRIKIDPRYGLKGTWTIKDLSPSGSFAVIKKGKDSRSISLADVTHIEHDGQKYKVTHNQLILNRRVNVKKTEMIAELIANCSCWEKEDEAALNAMPEAKLKSFFDHHTEHQQAQELIDNMDEEEEEEETPPMPPKKGKGKIPPQFAKNEEIEPVAPSVENSRQRLTSDELADIQWARSERERITNELIEQIISNENNPFTEEYLKSRSREELQGLAKLASNSAKPVTTNSAPARMQVLNFGGVAPGYTKNLGEDFAHQDQDMIPDPIDWASN